MLFRAGGSFIYIFFAWASVYFDIQEALLAVYRYLGLPSHLCDYIILRRVIINSIPNFGDTKTGIKGCCPYVQLFKCGKLVATAAPPVVEAGRGGGGEGGRQVELKWVSSEEGSVSFNVDSAVQGDLLLRCRHADSSGARVSMFRAAFHTGYASSHRSESLFLIIMPHSILSRYSAILFSLFTLN